MTGLDYSLHITATSTASDGRKASEQAITPNTLEMAFGYFLYWGCGMALIKCPECGREVSDTAVACPGCGYPIAAGAVESGEKTPEPSRPTKPTNMGAGGGDPAPDKSDLFKIHRPDLAKIHKRDSHRNLGQSIRATHPARADHWDDGGINDGIWPEDVVLSLDSDLVVGWKPPCGHQFPMPIKHWINNPACPKCGKRFEDPKPRPTRPSKPGPTRPSKPGPTRPSKPAAHPSKPAAITQTSKKAADEGGLFETGCGLLIMLAILLAILFAIGSCIAAAFEGDFDDCPKKANGTLDCSYQDLSGADLRETNFSGADFSGANLNGADFYEADLWNANFSGANLNGAVFKYTDLRNAHLSGLDLSGGGRLRGADLSGANLSGANLKGADLRDVNFSGADLKGADLQDADLSGSFTRKATNLSGADLRNANLSGANLKGADLRDADLSGLDLSGLNLSGSDLTGADLKGVSADTATRWPQGFDSKVAGVTITTTTTIQPLPPGFKLPPGDVIDRTATLHDHGRNEIHVKVRNSGTKHAYYCIDMRYEFPDDWEYLTEENWLLDQEGFGESIRLTYGTDYSIPPDGQERVLALERRPDWYGKMFYEYYTGGWTHYIVKFEKLSSPCK
jgi:uncharacterized protein YjbI with pentapeptide repeats/uncharacterized Zn finger protein (UPF0148 family)